MKFTRYVILLINLQMLSYFSTLVSLGMSRQSANLRFFIKNESMRNHQNIINKFYKPRENWATSNLGSYLFKYDYLFKPRIKDPEVARYVNEKGSLKVFIWKHWLWLIDRHMQSDRDYNYSKINPLYRCSVSNCKFSGKGNIALADAVVVHLQHGVLPNVSRRDPNQLWILWTDESPWNTFSLSDKRPSFAALSNIFNWSMTYRSDSEIPVPYGRTLPFRYPVVRVNNVTNDVLKEFVPYWEKKQKNVLATILSSNCVARRAQFLNELMEHMNIDVFGNCSTDKDKQERCPGYFRSDCNVTSEYLFYVVIENSKCRQYISEKSFHHGYSKGAIPVIMGSPVEDCMKLLPPDSFLHLDNFESPKHLALEIIAISKNISKLLSYHAWRNHFEVTNEHGYFETRSAALCRLCEALNYNDRSQKVYDLDDIRLYLDPKICCSPRV